MIENIRTQHDDGTATVLSAVLEATKTVEKKVKMENSGEPDSLLYMNLESVRDFRMWSILRWYTHGLVIIQP